VPHGRTITEEVNSVGNLCVVATLSRHWLCVRTPDMRVDRAEGCARLSLGSDRDGLKPDVVNWYREG